MRASTVLLKAAALIERTGLCKFELAVDVSGDPVSEMSRQAVAFCAMGALSRVTRRGDDIGYQGACYLLRGQVGHSIARWNNEPKQTKRGVIAKMRAVAKRAKAEGR